MKYLRFLLLFLIICNIAQAQDVSIKTITDKNKVLIGDFINYQIEVQYPLNSTYVFWPNINTETIKPFTIIDASKIDTISNANTIILKQKYTLACYDSGMYNIPKLELGYQQNNSVDSKIITSDSQWIAVNNVSININGDIKDIVEAEDKESDNKKIILALLVTAILIGLFLLIKYIRKNNFLGAKPKDAFKETQLLLQKANGEIENPKQFYSISIDAVKYYFTKRYNMQLMHNTSAEIIKIFEQHSILNNETPFIKKLLALADMAKFAQQDIDTTTNKNNLQLIHTLINTAEAQYQKTLQEKGANKK
jgi:hypothetical protein